MADMFEIPTQNSPLDIARDISNDEEVLDAIEDLMSAIEDTGREKGLTREEIEQATVGYLNDIRAIVSAAIEAGFEHVLKQRKVE